MNYLKQKMNIRMLDVLSICLLLTLMIFGMSISCNWNGMIILGSAGAMITIVLLIIVILV